MLAHAPRIRLIPFFDRYGHAWEVSCPCAWRRVVRHGHEAEETADEHKAVHRGTLIPWCLICRDRRSLVTGASPRNANGGWDRVPCPRCGEGGGNG